ncbi:MAG: hypothetical protein A3I76_00300 [Elusimicrobia bacterium RIFCSPLOWO2_02_FULL_61_11]|nr:MAG: hypothetical protein A3I76_00290 [Elusimicrobia bacterium RIFCSPLOWO2_02_FULL_61_11]OGS05593.1 MAG: hypothetical protein A3I76_00300 [Elusimicrobia bacterium RIFCSPLOWO2_02_FULL_61_11]
MCAAQKHFINKSLVADTAMLGLCMRPCQRYGMNADMNVPVFSGTFWRAAPSGALHIQSPLDSFFKSQRFLRRDPARF